MRVNSATRAELIVSLIEKSPKMTAREIYETLVSENKISKYASISGINSVMRVISLRHTKPENKDKNMKINMPYRHKIATVDLANDAIKVIEFAKTLYGNEFSVFQEKSTANNKTQYFVYIVNKKIAKKFIDNPDCFTLDTNPDCATPTAPAGDVKPVIDTETKNVVTDSAHQH